MSRKALLDVDVLIALFDADHVHHEIAHDWFEDHREAGWATCPLTENGFVRILSHPARGDEPTQAPELVDRLRTFCASGHHEFWPDSVSLLDEKAFNTALVRGHRHLTDIFLLGLAVKRGGCLVTLDQNVRRGAVKGARRESLVVISAAE